MPTFDDSFEIPFPGSINFEFGDTYAAQGNQTFSDGFEIPFLLNNFGDTYAAQGNQTFSNGFVIPHLLNSFGIQYSNVNIQSTFLTGFEIAINSKLWSPLDTAFEILPGPQRVPFFPTDPTMTEIIYPVVPISEANKVLFKLDSEEWRVTQKAAVGRNEDTDTIRFRVNTNYMATFIGDLHTNKANQFRLSTPGYTPFGSNSHDNYVRVLSHSRPQREDRGLTQTIDVQFLFVAVYP